MKLRSLTLLVLALACLCSVLHAQNTGFTLESKVPATTLAYASFPHVTQAREALAKTQFAQLCQEPEMRAFFTALVNPFQPQIDQAWQQLDMVLGLSADKVASIFHGEMALAVVDIDLQNRMMPLGLVLSLQFGPNRAAVDELLQLAQTRIGITWEEQDKGGQKVFAVTGIPVAFTFIEDVLLVSNRPDLLAPQSVASLQQNQSFQKTKAKVHKTHTPIALVYFNVQQLRTQFAGMVPPAAEPVLNNLGLFDVQGLALAVNVYGDYLHNAIFVEMQGERRGIMRLFHGDACGSELIKEAPKDAIGYTACRTNLAWLLAEVESDIKLVEPSGMLLGMYQQFWQDLEGRIGFSINDVAASLGNDAFSFQYMPADGGLIPYTIGILTIKDNALFHKWLEPFAKKFGLEIKSVQHHGTEIRYFSATLGQLGTNPFDTRGKNPGEEMVQSLGIGLSGMAFFIEGGRLYYGNSMHDVKSFVDARGNWKEHLGDNADFQKVMQNLPPSSILIYQDWRVLLGSWWNTLNPFLRAFEGFMRKAGIPFDSALLPQAQTISKHLVPSGFSYSSDADGVLMQAYTVTGGLVYIVPAGVLFGAVAIPMIEKDKQRKLLDGNEDAAIDMLRNLATAQSQFQSNCVVDQDEDKIGEYGFLQELAGIMNPRGKTEPLQPGYIAPTFVESIHEGVILYHGYYFYCYLPGAETAIGEAEGIGNIAAASADQQESRYVIYAWPVEYGKTGNRTFVINQAGEVHYGWESGYSLANKPAAHDAFLAGSEKADNLEGDLAKDESGYAGYWQTLSTDEEE